MPRTVNVMTGETTRGAIVVPDKDIPKKSTEYFKQISKPKASMPIPGNAINVRELIGLAKLLNREVGVCQQGSTLFLISGSEVDPNDTSRGGAVSPLENSRMLIHVHPSTHSHKSHFATDHLANTAANKGPEAVVDFNYDLFVIDRHKLRSTPDNTNIGAQYNFVKGITPDSKYWPPFLESSKSLIYPDVVPVDVAVASSSAAPSGD